MHKSGCSRSRDDCCKVNKRVRFVRRFQRVIFSEFSKLSYCFLVAFIIGCVCFNQYTADMAFMLRWKPMWSGTGAVTADYWKSLVPDAAPRSGMFSTSGYSNWGDFAGLVLAGSIVGLIGCAGGAGGRYGEQRFLATKNTREASMMAALWQFLGLPRWVMTAGLCFLWIRPL